MGTEWLETERNVGGLYLKPRSTTDWRDWEEAPTIGYKYYNHITNTIFKVITAVVLTIHVLWALISFVTTIVGTIYDMIYLLTAIGLSPGGRSTVHIYTQTIHRMIQNKKEIVLYKNFENLRAVPHICELPPGTWLTTEEKARKNLSQGSRRVPAGTMKLHNHTIIIHRRNNKNT